MNSVIMKSQKNRTFRSFRPMTVLFFAVLICLGCSKAKRPEGMPKLFPCSITVTQENEPLKNAFVSFESSDPTLAKWPITGTTNADGEAIMNTYGKYSGVPAGEYVVVLKKEETVYDDGKPEQTEADIDKASAFRPGTIFTLVDPETTVFEKSPLKAAVEQRSNSIKLDAGKKVRIKLSRLSKVL